MKEKEDINKLKKKIIKRNFSVGIIGLGYVGLPICARFIKANIRVFGIDNDIKKINSLKKGLSYIKNDNLKNFNYFEKYKNQVSNNYKIFG